MSRILHNPFYMGIMQVGTTGETFEGNHEPLVSKALFDRVQAILAGKLYPRTQIHRMLFRRLIKCDRCGRSLVGERQKGHVYYRCHDWSCRGTSVREEHVDALVRSELAALRVDDGEVGDFRAVIREGLAEDIAAAGERAERTERDLALVEERMNRLTDAVLDGTIDKDAYTQRKAALIAQKLAIRDRERAGSLTGWQKIAEWFELAQTALESYEIGDADEKRATVQSVSSNLLAVGKEPVFPLFYPFKELRNWRKLNDCDPTGNRTPISCVKGGRPSR